MKTRAAAIMAAILGGVGMSMGIMTRAIPKAPANRPEQYVPMKRRSGKGRFNKPRGNYASRNGINVTEARARNGVGRPPDHKRKVS